jgi:hypothetical protein
MGTMILRCSRHGLTWRRGVQVWGGGGVQALHMSVMASFMKRSSFGSKLHHITGVFPMLLLLLTHRVFLVCTLWDD